MFPGQSEILLVIIKPDVLYLPSISGKVADMGGYFVVRFHIDKIRSSSGTL